MATSPKPLTLQAIDALQAGERRQGARLLETELRTGPGSGERWRSVAKLAAHIGEIEMSLAASQRVARTAPLSPERLLYYWGELASYGRTQIALDEIARLPAGARNHPGILHFLGTIAGQRGDFAGAEDCYRRVLATSPMQPQTWFALAMIKRFSAGDPDISAMEKHRAAFRRAEPDLAARFLYGLAKAYYDTGDHDRAFALYAEGADLRRGIEQFDRAALSAQVDQIIATFTPEALAKLTPSGARKSRAIFVNGLPRSGTTLVEQILVSHSRVTEGGEVNALHPALIPTGDYTLEGARRYDQRATSGDPWGEVAEDYHRTLGMWFGGDGLIVDKTLTQARLMGLLLHALPTAPVIWMRRNPEDTALSAYRSYFTASVPWSWSFTDIGHYYREEDRLFAHWTQHFGDRILTVYYEDLVRAPSEWIPRILERCGLADEPQVHQPHTVKRDVRTASVQQVRAPISADRIGSAEAIKPYMDAFRAAYFD
ncbi:tetratricopeptide repeat-containing sulfotransferase family protein [Sphingomonas soli]|uniref:tetratricopeptide repeat-containing sulfotransferase family protein n=1 Tax=Sphingomonas soli TaxID=266127 RepID=UPI00082A9CC0|nr:sulfotransferase [Sphingomonas soli]